MKLHLIRDYYDKPKELDKSRFHARFCADLLETEADFMAEAQVPLGLPATGEVAAVIEEGANGVQ